MVICKYYLQGNCRFGDACKNEHSYNENTSSVLVKKPDIDINVLVKAAAGDMLKAEKGSQWPLSCYGPFQGKPCFPGFEDKSFDEVRLGFYETQQNGTSDQYKQQLAQLLQETQLKMKALQNPSPEASNMLKNIYCNTQNTFNNTDNSAFGSKPPSYSSSIFGNTVQANQQTQNFVFAQPENKSAFGNTQATFQSNTSIFGNTNYQNFANTAANKSVFGATTPNSSIFGSPTPNQSLFGGGTTTPNPFGSANNQNLLTAVPNQDVFTSIATTQNIFTSSAPSQSIFTNTAPNQNIFTSSTPNQNIFGSTTPTQGVFTSVAPSQNVFTSSALNQNIFSNAVSSQNLFTSAAPSQNVFPNVPVSQNVFATAPTNTASIFGGSQHPQTFGNQGTFQNSLTQGSIAPTNYTQSIFGQTASANQPNFGNVYSNQNNSPFLPTNSPAPATDIFQKASSNFSQTPVQNSVFSQNPSQSHSASIFGNRTTQTATANMTRVDDPTIYSKLSDLTSNDLTQFENQCFEFGKIPIRAPPLEMC